MRAKVWLGCALAGVLAVGAGAQPPKVEAPKAPTGARVGDPLGAMLADAKAALARTRDYTCTFTRQELIKGALSAEQVAEMKVRHNPPGVYVRFARPDAVAGMEAAYTGAKRNGKFQYRPAGVSGAKGFRLTDLDDTKFLAGNRHPVSDWTMLAALDRVTAAVAREKTLNNPVEVYTGDFQFAGRNVTRYEVLTRRPHAFRYAHRMLVFVDKETKLPVRFEAYDQPRSGAATGELLEAYSFSDVKLNVGLGENSFDF